MTKFILDEYKGKKVMVTGHTGFKGSWLCQMLIMLGADVTGYSLEPDSSNTSFEAFKLEKRIKSYYGDIRNLETIKKVFREEEPQFVFHLAAQSLVLPSYDDPVHTYSTNVMGTVNICECARQTSSVKSFVNVTTDKVYENKEWVWGYRENEALNGYDPYSNSKSCSELVTSSYKKSFFDKLGVPISTARAGNVIGGGDRCKDRIIPDCVRAAISNDKIVIRNPNSVRPYQHVIEPLYAYLLIAIKQALNCDLAGNYNVGPEARDCLCTKIMVDYFCDSWGGVRYVVQKNEKQQHEANFLRLDASLIKNILGWKPIWSTKQAIKNTVEWERAFLANNNMIEFSLRQIKEYLKEVTVEPGN